MDAEQSFAQVFGTWNFISPADARGRALYERHYSSRRFNDATRVNFVGPGKSLAMLSASADALFVWRQQLYRLDDQAGIECAVFRNESPRLSSELIQEALAPAWEYWPTENRMFTFVHPRKVKSANPGYCFKKAGWSLCGKTTKGLLILEYFR